MAEMVINKDSQTFGGGVNTSSRATFGLKTQDVIASVSEAIQRIFTKTNHKTQCHSELFDKANKRNIELCEPVPRVAESHVVKIPCQARDDKRGILPLCKALAFTLAETLIVMGIIGVVAALTIPNLNSSTADKEKVAKVKKLYSNLNDALGRAIAVYGPFDEWFSGDANATAQVTRAGERMTEFMKVSKNCKTSSGCFANTTVQYLNGDDMKNIDKNSSYYKVILADGTSLAISKSFLVVDIDGLKGSSTKGKDFFEFYIRENGIYPENNSTDCTNDENGTCLSDSCFQEGSCAGWVIETGNMDYLKADDSGKCPNGKQLSWTNTSCK